MRTTIFALLLSTASFAQTPMPMPIGRFPENLKTYLGLNDTQETRILQLNSDYFQFEQQKNLRAAQVHLEIAEETARPSPDPVAIGQGYVELEAIRRELSDRKKKLNEDVVNVLNTDQRNKLKSLSDAMALQPMIVAAQCENLLPPTLQVVPSLQLFPATIIPASRIAPLQFTCFTVTPFPGPIIPQP